VSHEVTNFQNIETVKKTDYILLLEKTQAKLLTTHSIFMLPLVSVHHLWVCPMVSVLCFRCN